MHVLLSSLLHVGGGWLLHLFIMKDYAMPNSNCYAGLMVTLSTLLVIAATTAVTFNIIGHTKTIMIIAGAAVIFNEAMPRERLLGITIAVAGIIWYSYLRMSSHGIPSAHEAAVQKGKMIQVMQVSREDCIRSYHGEVGDFESP